MKSHQLLYMMTVLSLGISGCRTGGVQADSGSPAGSDDKLLGTWRGQSKVDPGSTLALASSFTGANQVAGPSTLTLNPDGKGFIKIARSAEKPIAWRTEGQKMIMEVRGFDGSKVPNTDKADNGPWVGTLAADEKSLFIDMGDLSVNLNR